MVAPGGVFGTRGGRNRNAKRQEGQHMATVTPPRSSRNLEQDRSRIKSPLVRLRKYIHAYVSVEGATLVGLFLALWFWIGLLLDYGMFRLFTVDWVQELPWSFRLVVLLALVLAIGAIVVLKIVTRLITDFSDAAVAIVLERRFPGLLGDRLITAVELSDPTRTAEIDAIGYSRPWCGRPFLKPLTVSIRFPSRRSSTGNGWFPSRHFLAW